MNTIFILVLIPIRKNKWKFYINSNVRDSYTLKRDKLEDFLKKSINHILYNSCIWYLDRFFPIIIDVKKNKINKLKLNQEEVIKKLKYEKIKETRNPDVIKKKLLNKNNDKFNQNRNANDNLVKKYYKT